MKNLTKKTYKNLLEASSRWTDEQALFVIKSIYDKVMDEADFEALADYAREKTADMDNDEFIDFIYSILNDENYSWMSDFEDYFHWELKLLYEIKYDSYCYLIEDAAEEFLDYFVLFANKESAERGIDIEF